MSTKTFSNEFFASVFSTIAVGCEFEQPYTDNNRSCYTKQYFNDFFGRFYSFNSITPKDEKIVEMARFFQSENNKAYNDRYCEQGENFFPVSRQEIKTAKRLSILEIIKSLQAILYNLPEYEQNKEPEQVKKGRTLVSNLCTMIVMSSTEYNSLPWGEIK